MKTKLMAMLLVAGGSLFAQHLSVGVGIGAPGYYGVGPVAPPPVAVGAYRPPCPGPGYVWMDGYYGTYGNWIAGYWALPPYTGAYWVAPRLYGGHAYAGYWGGPRYAGPGFRAGGFSGGGYARGGGIARGGGFGRGGGHGFRR